MSHLRAPAARADRREGGRHGRPVAQPAPAPAETPLRHQLMRLAVLPPVAVALSACAAVLFTIRSTGARPTTTLWTVLAGALAVTLAGIVIAAVAARRATASVRERLHTLRGASARGEADLRTLVEALRRGETPPTPGPRGGPGTGADEFELLAAELAHAHDSAVAAVLGASQLSSRTGSEQKLEVFLNLARRLQSLVHREISILDELENEIEDPDLLKGLFHVDHLATRIRRHAENLAVLGGAVSRRQWSTPVPMTEVLRSATAEVEQYVRVRLVPPVEGTLRGHAVADVVHLLAELVENATVFSLPHTQVVLRAGLVTSGLAVEVEDRGLGMPPAELSRMNALLADPDQVNVAGLLADGRIGLFVVSQLARRHGIHVRLQANIYGGVQAVLVVPPGLLGEDSGTAESMTAGPPRTGESGRAPLMAAGVAGVREADGAGTHTQALPQWDGAVGRPASGALEHPVPRHLHDDRTAHPQGDRTAVGRARSPLPAPARDAGDLRPESAVRPPLPGIPGGAAPLPDAPAQVLGGPPRTGRFPMAPGGRPVPQPGIADGEPGRPHLPRRRAQEHIAPQLRGSRPAPASQDTGTLAGHDPGLMAAFRRGISLAEARQQQDAEPAGTTGRAETGAPTAHRPDLTVRRRGTTPSG
ncbi:ATP-binding protein [Streptomyces sp. NPDC096198]|uniref:sensor histidine kinase n=1 Tax=Streptomyces sp. NPDC096198 TaxID=3366080 RepID=UPI0038211540